MHIFISHSSKDAETAMQVCRLLEEHGKPCFIAPRDIRMGKEYAAEIVDGIDHAQAVVLLMSRAANQSPHVLREVERAVSKSIPILVCKLEEVELSKSMEYFLMAHQWVCDGTGEDDSKILAILRDFEKQKEQKAIPEQKIPNQKIPNQKVPNRIGRGIPAKRRLQKAAVMLLLIILLAVGLGACYFAKTGRVQTAGDIALKEGDTVVFGSYNGEPISWRVLKVNEDQKSAVLVAKHVLTMKAFDAAESGSYNRDDTKDYWGQQTEADTDLKLQAYVRGSSEWRTSNIRTWLNSEDEVVAYTDQPPKKTAMAEHKNGYEHETGFLYDFTEAERAALLETEIVTRGNAVAESETITTQDRVYLLSREELKWFEEAGMNQLALPTEVAVTQDESGWYALELKEYGIKECSWWLRDPVENASSLCYMVGNGYADNNIWERNAGLEGFGIRPAVTVDLSAGCLQE
ncbi:MAG: toll/interleukin-1 receptor domain-containing protein [Clostridiales bacterium]|nr:toll/interleukin-1 receptor domain-containing protein [Clostridiales bacterium]